ncbi:MAG: N-acetyltransferase [Planctomycetaceae bacterium]|nr:N-acetyltransferase [Planctomycetaceae bacterium]
MTTLRPETPHDAAAIHALLVDCFPTDAEARLVDQLRAAGRLLVSYVAEVEGQIVGHVAFSPVTVASGATGVGLAPVAVQVAQRRRGIAADLVTAGLAACRSLDYRWAVVLGNPAYYARFGFRPAREFGLSDEYGGGDAFQAFELQPHAIPRDAGLVRYAPEFAVFGEASTEP